MYDVFLYNEGDLFTFDMPVASKSRRIPRIQILTTVGLIILIIALPFTLALLRLILDTSSQADEEAIPTELVVSNITDTHATVSWTTDIETEGYIRYGTSESSLNLLASDLRDLGKEKVSAYRQHLVDINNLSPGTTYFFQVYSNGIAADNSLKSFRTDSLSAAVQLPKTYKGKVNIDQPYLPVYIFAANGRTASEIRSSYTAGNGTFTFDVADLQTQNGDTAFPLEDSKLVVYVNGLDAGKARVIADPANNEVINIVLEESDIAFNHSAQISSDSIPTEPTESDDPIIGKPSLKEPEYGIDLMNVIYSNNRSQQDPIIPTNIFVSNPTEVSFQINWTTWIPTSGYIMYGESTLDKQVLDIRDSSPDIKRYTHSVKVTNTAWEAGDVIYFKIYSEGNLYGNQGEAVAYEYVVPEALSSPPQPAVLGGVLDLLDNSELTISERDYIIYAKSNSAAFISTVPAFNSKGWSLSVGNMRSSDLLSGIEPSEITVYVLGGLNSQSEKKASDLEQDVVISLSPGLSIKNVTHQASYPTLPNFVGTAAPNTQVTVTTNERAYTAQSNSVGNWQIVPEQLPQGQHILQLNNNSTSFMINYQIDLDMLPLTSIEPGILLYLAGIVLVACGLLLVYYSRRYQ